MSLHMLGAPVWRVSDDPADVVSQRMDSLKSPRQGLASFHPATEEIVPGADTRVRIRRHYPSMADIEGQEPEEYGDAWAEDLVGDSDFTALNRGPVGSIKVYSIAQAREVLRGGQAAIARAKDLAKETFTRPALSGAAARDNVFWKLDWHAKNLASLGSVKSTDTYASTDDLRKWALAAYGEENAVEEGHAEQDRAAARKLGELNAAVASLPMAVGKAVGKVAGDVIEGATGIPTWAWGVGGVALVGLLGVGAWKILFASAPVVARVAAERYLP